MQACLGKLFLQFRNPNCLLMIFNNQDNLEKMQELVKSFISYDIFLKRFLESVVVLDPGLVSRPFSNLNWTFWYDSLISNKTNKLLFQHIILPLIPLFYYFPSRM